MKIFYKLKYFTIVVGIYLLNPKALIKMINTYLLKQRCNEVKKTSNSELVSIIIVTYNALDYVKLCLESLSKTKYDNYEIIVVDNNSNLETKKYLYTLKKNNVIKKLIHSKKNLFFTKGNNIGAENVSSESRFLLFLNSDVEIKSKYWLTTLISNSPANGIVSLGTVFFPVIRPDGYCYLIDRKTFNKNKRFNEKYLMNGSITEFTARVIKRGGRAATIMNHDKLLVHYGGKSYGKKRDFLALSSLEILELYDKLNIKLLTLK